MSEGVRVILFHPAWSASCETCQSFSRGSDGVFRFDSRGKPHPRPPAVPTPCRICPKVPDYAKEVEADPDKLRAVAADLTPEQRKAFSAYRQFRAVGSFPNDPIVRWYSAIFRDVEDAHTRYQDERRSIPLEIIAELLKVRYAR